MSNKGKKLVRPTWSIFDEFEKPRRTRSWSELDAFVARGREFAEQRCRAFPGLLKQWDERLAYLDGDPCRIDWTQFRPLQAEREEDWSDWLQHFIARSTTGRFSQLSFARCGFATADEWAEPLVIREDATEDRRADLVIRWRNGERSHVEVKVGDLSLAKTLDTALKLEKKYGGKWTHYLLLPSEDAEHWAGSATADGPTVTPLIWDDIAIAMRRALLERKERHGWLAWAHGFCGLIEQKLLGHPFGASGAEGLGVIRPRLRQISIMQKGLDDV